MVKVESGGSAAMDPALYHEKMANQIEGLDEAFLKKLLAKMEELEEKGRNLKKGVLNVYPEILSPAEVYKAISQAVQIPEDLFISKL